MSSRHIFPTAISHAFPVAFYYCNPNRRVARTMCLSWPTTGRIKSCGVHDIHNFVLKKILKTWNHYNIVVVFAQPSHQDRGGQVLGPRSVGRCQQKFCRHILSITDGTMIILLFRIVTAPIDRQISNADVDARGRVLDHARSL